MERETDFASSIAEDLEGQPLDIVKTLVEEAKKEGKDTDSLTTFSSKIESVISSHKRNLSDAIIYQLKKNSRLH